MHLHGRLAADALGAVFELRTLTCVQSRRPVHSALVVRCQKTFASCGATFGSAHGLNRKRLKRGRVVASVTSVGSEWVNTGSSRYSAARLFVVALRPLPTNDDTIDGKYMTPEKIASKLVHQASSGDSNGVRSNDLAPL